MLKRTIISALQPLVANRVYTVRHGLAAGLQRRGGLGFLPPMGTRSSEELFLEDLDLDGETVYDVGGHEGVFALFFARRVGASGLVVTFEPNPRNLARIVENVRLNRFPNVVVRSVALGEAPGRAALVFPPSEPACGSLVADIQDQMRQGKRVDAVEVDVDAVDRLVDDGLPVPDFVKIDVEGLEYAVLKGMAGVIARRHPRLYIEIHGSTPARKLHNATAVVEYLWRHDYHVHHIESAAPIRHRDRIASAIEGHLYCS